MKKTILTTLAAVFLLGAAPTMAESPVAGCNHMRPEVRNLISKISHATAVAREAAGNIRNFRMSVETHGASSPAMQSRKKAVVMAAGIGMKILTPVMRELAFHVDTRIAFGCKDRVIPFQISTSFWREIGHLGEETDRLAILLTESPTEEIPI